MAITITTNIRGGGFGIDIADISYKEGLVKMNCMKEAQKCSHITAELNLTGKSENNNCEAYGEVVDCQIGLGTFDLVGDYAQAKCPIYQNEINLSTCTFYKWEYTIVEKKTKETTTLVKTPWKRVEKDYEFFDYQLSEIVTWLKLIFQKKPLWIIYVS